MIKDSKLKNIDELKNEQGVIFGLQNFCIHDGPGIRSTVFLKGCPLRCLWCHNPEGISSEMLLSFDENRCILCGECAKVCPEVHQIVNKKHIVNRGACTIRKSCAAQCPADAISIVGETVTVEDVVSKVLRDKKYYDTSKGGVTISGGEPAMQPNFTYALLKVLFHENIHTALETSGFAKYSIYESLLPFVNLFLFDYKEKNPKLHKKFTGVDNTLIIENLHKLHKAGANIILRCPIIHGLNDRDEHFRGIAAIFHKLNNLIGAEVLPYHKLAASKTNRLGIESQQEFEQLSLEETERWSHLLRKYDVNVIET